MVLVYHHVSNQTPASTSISPERFREHLTYLSENYQVLPLPEIVDSLRQNRPLPDRAVAITFDDGFENILQNGHPILREFGFSYTVFINPGQIGKLKNQLTWEQVSLMQEQGVYFANHSYDHQHMLQRNAEETEQQWLARRVTEINKAEAMISKKTGNNLKYFAYPYGEFNQALSDALLKEGYVGFGQHSGAMASHSDFGALPRFAAAGIYASLNSLKTKLASLAMPVTNKLESDPELTFTNQGTNQKLTLDTSDLRTSQVGCFLNGKAMTIDKTKDSVDISLDTPIKSGRTRINCTAPSIKERGRYYWYSQPWFVPTESGTWLE